MLSTPKFQPAPCVMLVALHDSAAEQLRKMAAPLPVLRVAHAHAARERLAVTMPLAVVVHPAVAQSDLDALREAAVAVGADVLSLMEPIDEQAVRGWLARVMIAARTRRGG